MNNRNDAYAGLSGGNDFPDESERATARMARDAERRTVSGARDASEETPYGPAEASDAAFASDRSFGRSADRAFSSGRTSDRIPGRDPRRAAAAEERTRSAFGGRSAGRSSAADDPQGSAASGRRSPDDSAAGAQQPRFRIFTGDRVLWIIVAALAVISVLVVYSSTAKMAYDAYAVRTTAHFLRQQLMILAFSLGIMVLVHKIDCRFYNRLSKPVYLLSVLLTVAVYFIGHTTNGAARWIPLGPFQFQPSEALKVATVLFLARQLAGRQSKIDKLRIVPSLRFWTWRSDARQRKIWREGTWPVLMPVAAACAVIFPAHTSSAVLVFAASWVMMLIGRVRMGELLKLAGLACMGVVLVMMLNLGRSETAEGRVSTWIHLWTQPQDTKPLDRLTDTERSMIAIHNGGLLGEGAGQSAMRVEMIHPESDYAYAFFVEEYGILLAVALLLLYLWVFFRAIEIFRRCGTAFPGLLVLGLALLITCQALLHIMVTVNLIPETGQTLPLISRGGSSVLFTAMALGMILSVSRQNDEHSHVAPRAESIYER